jgi:hypothetical protein
MTNELAHRDRFEERAIRVLGSSLRIRQVNDSWISMDIRCKSLRYTSSTRSWSPELFYQLKRSLTLPSAPLNLRIAHYGPRTKILAPHSKASGVYSQQLKETRGEVGGLHDREKWEALLSIDNGRVAVFGLFSRSKAEWCECVRVYWVCIAAVAFA